MPMFQNTYRKLDMDTAVNKYDNQSYVDCRNLRLISLEANKSGALSVIKGNKLLGYFPDESQFIGGLKVRNKLIMFTAYPTDWGGSKPHNGCIWVANAYNTNPWSPLNYVYRGELNMDTENPIIDVVGFYESEKIIKVYWTDGKNNLRYCNVADPATTLAYTPEQLEIVQEMNLVQPELDSITAGNIPVGMVQYCYRLYKNNGHASNFSVPGRLIPITTKSETFSRTNLYGGSDALNSSGDPKNSGKGITLTLAGLPSNYDRVEVVALHYKTINSPPDISIVGVYNLSDIIFVTDTGIYNSGTYSLEEFLFINNPFVCKTLAVKNNILFAANIKESEYDVSYDARAYRWDKRAHPFGDGMCKIYNKDGSYWLNINPMPDLWVNYTAADVYIRQVENTADLPIDIDAICRNNIAYNKYQTNIHVEKYQKAPNGNVIGGTGVNVSYSFSGERRKIDVSAGALGTGTGSKWAWNLWGVGVPKPNYYNDYSGTTYNQSQKTWVRDETYRFGVVFFDKKGRPSPVKWIADIRMPAYDVLISPGSGGNKSYQYFSDGVDVIANVLKVNFQVSNIPSSAKYCQIVYVPREEKDKTCVLQGRVGWFLNTSSIYDAQSARLCNVSAYNALSATDRKFLYLISPEISFFKRYQKSNQDFLQIIGTNKAFTQGAGGTSIIINNATKFYDFTPAAEDPSKWQEISTAEISDYPSPPDVAREAEGFSTYQYRKRMRDPHVPSGTPIRYGDLGTCLLLDIKNAVSTSGLSTSEFMFASIRRNLFGVQYGGNSYQDRTRNVYIPAGPIVSVVGGSASAVASWGDSWIAYHDNLTCYYNAAITNRRQYTELIPVETSVNLPFRHDDCFHRLTESSKFYLKETGNAEFTISGTTYTPGWTDMYVYNTTYSKLPDSVKYYPAPLDYDPDSISDTLVKASYAKLGKEAIDPWTSFGFGESINVDNEYGPISRLVTWKNSLFCFQDDAVSVLSVLDRSLIGDNNESKLSLGEGGILTRYDYITTELGSSTRSSIVTTENGLYWYDNKRKKFNRFRGGEGKEDLGSVKGVASYLSSIPKECGIIDNTNGINGAGFQVCHNPLYNEVWLTVKKAWNNGETLIYNEVLDSFVGFMDSHLTRNYLSYDDKLLSQYYTGLWFENEGNFGHFYNTYYNSYVTMVVNPMPNIPVTFTNYEITSEVWSGLTQVHDKTITSIRTQNDYQDTGVINLNNTNSRRLLRTWRLDAKRNSSDSARLRDTYAKVTMSFTNNSNNYNLVLHDLVTLYMVPAESIASKFSQQQQK